MGIETKIEWCDHTFNPWIGCTKVGPGCDHCYAEADFDKRRRIAKWGAGNPRVRTSGANWRQPLKWDAKAKNLQAAWDRGLEMVKGDEAELLRRGFVKPHRPRVFCASLADVFDNEVDIAWLADLLTLIAKTPNIDWLLLTKRIGNWRKQIDQAVGFLEHRLASGSGDNSGYSMSRNWLAGEPPHNVWIGATVVNQPELDRDYTKLVTIPAVVRFVSIEPMLGAMTFDCWPLFDASGVAFLHWVICGGESGPKARPSHPDWYRSLRDQCAAAGVPFLFKQWGEWQTIDDMSIDAIYRTPGSTPGHRFPDGIEVYRTGKKNAGRLLDGVEHNGYPAGVMGGAQ